MAFKSYKNAYKLPYFLSFISDFALKKRGAHFGQPCHEKPNHRSGGEDGYADMERHNTDHDRDDHSNPHDHEITWEGNHPNWGEHIDYPEGSAPDFEGMFGGGKAYMKGKTIYLFPEDNRFETISDFKWCLKCGGEIQFRWKGQDYGVVRYGVDNKITVYRAHDKDSQRAYNTPDDALGYMIGDDRLRDIITQVEVIFRSI